MIKGWIYRAKMSTSKWIKRHTEDPYVKKSIKEGYRSRAVYKLEEIQLKYSLLKPNQKVLDLGAAPGSWSQYIRKQHPNSTVVAIDIINIGHLDGVECIRGDIEDTELLQKLKSKHGQFDLIVSDIAPSFSGEGDHQEQIQLNKMCICAAGSLLKTRGDLLMKTFIGVYQKQLVTTLQIFFREVRRVKPKASRSESSQQFLVCLDLRGETRELMFRAKGLQYNGKRSKQSILRLLG